MENNSGELAHGLSATEARAQLGALADSRAALADLAVTPRWYHPVLAGLVTVFITTQASQQWWIVGFTIYCAGLVWLVAAYRNLSGVWSTSWNFRGARGYLVAVSVVLLAALALSILVRSGALAWGWAPIAGVGAGLFIWWTGPRLDAACRAHLRDCR